MEIIRSVCKSVGRFLPEKVVTNGDLSKMMDTTDEWIKTRTGIEERRIAGVDVGTSDLALAACEDAMKKAGVEAKEIDLIIAATLSPDHYFPGIGVQLQDRLGCRTIPAIDVRGQCSGFTWGLTTADAMMRTGLYRKVLVVGAEIHSRILEFTNEGRHVSVLFGDGAGAIYLEAETGGQRPSIDNNISGIIDSEMGSDGSGVDKLAMLRPGMGRDQERFVTQEEADGYGLYPVMDGKQVFKNAVMRMAEVVETLLKRNGASTEDIDLLVPHQANLRIIESLREKFQLPHEKVIINIQKLGNTTAGTLPLGLYDAIESGRLKSGDLVVTVAFGSGYTWGANLIRW